MWVLGIYSCQYSVQPLQGWGELRWVFPWADAHGKKTIKPSSPARVEPVETN
jgi:hypothetical protein